jgi:hypothetical protein
LLSTNEVRARAAEFAREWKAARYEAGEKQTFYDEFFRVFGRKRRQVATFRRAGAEAWRQPRLHRPLVERQPAGRAQGRNAMPVTALLHTYARRIRELRRADPNVPEPGLAPIFQELLRDLIPTLEIAPGLVISPEYRNEGVGRPHDRFGFLTSTLSTEFLLGRLMMSYRETV